jgi:hypothetical protein
MTKTELIIAERMLRLRASMAGYLPGEYDLRHDPDDLIGSVLLAMRTYCDECNIDWQAELRTVEHLRRTTDDAARARV